MAAQVDEGLDAKQLLVQLQTLQQEYEMLQRDHELLKSKDLAQKTNRTFSFN